MRLPLLVLWALSALCADPKFIYPLPAPEEVVVTKDIAYSSWNGQALLMDVYRPARAGKGARLPVIVLMNAFGGTSQRDWEIYTAWGKVAAVGGFVAVNPDTHTEGVEQDFDAIVVYLRVHAAELMADPEQVGVFAASGHVPRAFPMVEDPKRTSVKAAAMYYGVANVKEFRLDLPVLYVRAGLDRPGLNRVLDELAAAAVRSNAPVTVLNVSGGRHGFEMLDHHEAARAAIADTLRFFRTTLTAQYQEGLRAGLDEAGAAAAVLRGDFAKAASLYASLVRTRPDDPRLLLSFGEALVGAGRHKEARAQFDKLKPLRAVGPRDLGVPAARACALDGDPAAAVAWLRTIPRRFLPDSLEHDPAFAGLRERPDFKALFARP